MGRTTNSLWAVPFDAERLELTGEPNPVLEGVQVAGNAVQYALAQSGTLTYIPGEAIGGVVEGVTGQKASPTWVGRDGRDAGVIVDEPLVSPRYLDLSPDASRLAVVVGLEEGEIWWHDVRGNPPVQLTDEGHNVLPTWRPDGSGVAFASTRNGVRNLFWMGTDDRGGPYRLDS